MKVVIHLIISNRGSMFQKNNLETHCIMIDYTKIDSVQKFIALVGNPARSAGSRAHVVGHMLSMVDNHKDIVTEFLIFCSIKRNR